MTDISTAIEALKGIGIESFELSRILVIPVDKPEDIYPTVEKARRVFKQIGYEKSWQVDPYYYEKRQNLNGQMYLNA